MAAKKPQKEVVVKMKRGLEFNCPKYLKMWRGSLTPEQFHAYIKNEKLYQERLKKKDNKKDNKSED